MRRNGGNSPIYFIGAVKKSLNNALYQLYDTDDERLIGHVIPDEVQDPGGYLEMLSEYLDLQEEAGKADRTQEGRSYDQLIRTPMKNPVATKAFQEEDVTNFRVFPKLRRIYVNREGVQQYEKENFICEVVFKNNCMEQMEILTSEICTLAKRVVKRFPIAQLDYVQPGLAEKTIEFEFRQRVDSVQTLQILTDAGWQEIMGHKVYVHDSAVLPDGYVALTGLNLPRLTLTEIQRRSIFEKALNLVTNQTTGYVITVFSFMGVLYRLLREAGFAPHFLLFICGKTGTMKTTVATILLNQLCDERFRSSLRRIDSDTETSFEIAVSRTGYDTILTFDDYAPAKTRRKKGQNMDKLESLIRMIGDGSTKSRSNANLQDVRGTGVQGMAAVTGEERGKGASSGLRCLYLSFTKNCVDKENASYFQSNTDAYPALLNYFAEFVGKHWAELVCQVQQQMPAMRTVIEEAVLEKRLVDTASLLSITGGIVCKFLVEYCAYGQVEASCLHMKMMDAAIDATISSMDFVQEESFSLTFLKALLELLQTNKLRIHEGKIESAVMLGEFAGYCDKEFYYLYLAGCFDTVRSYINNRNGFFNLSLEETVNQLYQDGLLIASKNGKTMSGDCRLNKYWRVQIEGVKGKVNFIKMRKKIFDQVINCENAQEFEELFRNEN